MPEKAPTWLDILLTVWVFVVGIAYFGGYFAAQLGSLGPPLAAFAQYGFIAYTVMVFVSVLVLALRYLHRNDADVGPTDGHIKTSTKKRK
jgi:uncharacterized membrane protein YqaE (UPF0057 family)